MTTPTRDEAREDMTAYVKALIANRTECAVHIERKYGLYGHTPQVVSIALSAAAKGDDYMQAVDEYLEGEEG
jgi:hypothetical protein